MKKTLILLLVIFFSCNTTEFPKKLGKASAQTHLCNYEFNGYDFDKKETKEGKMLCLIKEYGKEIWDKFYRLAITDGKRPPCITRYAYSVGTWDGESFKNPKFSDDNVTLYIGKYKDYETLYRGLCSYYNRSWSRGRGLEGCEFFKKHVKVSFQIIWPYCIILKKGYVKPLTKVEAEEYLKNHPETVKLEA